MPASPPLALVDPDPRVRRRSALRRRLPSLAVGVAVAAVSALPFVLALGR